MKSKMFATDHHDAGEHEPAVAERPGRADVDDDADERQRVRVDAQRDARAMMARSGNMQIAPMSPVKVIRGRGRRWP